MRRRTAGAVALLVVALTGCGSSDAEPEPEPVPASPLSQVTIYSSLPEQGPDADETAAVRRGMALALAEAGMRAGGIRVIHRELDNAGAPDGWTPERVSQNARRAVQDDSTALYLGELRSAASTLSMPILNEAGIPQISPAATAIGLVEGGPGAEEGEPERYYPTGERHFVRLMPGDGAQAGVLAALMAADGCERLALVGGTETEGAALAAALAAAAAERGLEPAYEVLVGDDLVRRAPQLAMQASVREADCLAYTGEDARGALALLTRAGQQLDSDASLYVTKGVAEPGLFAPPTGLPVALAPRVTATLPTRGESSPSPTRQALVDELGAEPRTPGDLYALYGYETMRLALDAIARSRTGRPPDVLEALFETDERRSVLGTYAVQDSGDSTLDTYGVYGVEGGRLAFRRLAVPEG